MTKFNPAEEFALKPVKRANTGGFAPIYRGTEETPRQKAMAVLTDEWQTAAEIARQCGLTGVGAAIAIRECKQVEIEKPKGRPRQYRIARGRV